MTRLGSRLLEFLAGALDPQEREVVLGDIAESGEALWQATIEVLSLAAHRQIELWKDPQPWIALLGAAGIYEAGLIRITRWLDAGLMIRIEVWWRFGVPYESGQTTGGEIVWFSGLFLAVLAGSLGIGTAAAFVSGRTAWLTSAIFFLIVAKSLWYPRLADVPRMLLQVVLFASFIISEIAGVQLILKRNTKGVQR